MNIFRIHIFTYIFVIIVLLTGYFNKFILLMTIIFIHELGHITAAILLKWKIKSVLILPFGCLTIFDEKLNRSLNEELVIVLLGPVFQMIAMYFITDVELFKYCKILLIFNLLPFYPLDGSKILNILLNKLMAFKKSHLITMYISFLSIFFIKKNLILFIVIVLLLKTSITELINHKYIFYKFLYERYLYKFNFKKIQKINNINKVKKNYRFLIKQKNFYITEKEYLNTLFKKP